MKPLSQRLKDFPTSHFVDWLCLACVDVREVRTPDDAQEEINKIREAVAERLVALEQRAEAAEAKLKAQSKAEPDYYATQFRLLTKSEVEQHRRIDPCMIGLQRLFRHPAPAINLAELVPPKASMSDFYETVTGGNRSEPDEAGIAMCDACRAAMLRNIEEANK